ncbi:MAG: hypothetical protein HFH93_13020 [Lachnospiraceae bacterium]|nr:hypothetical protein [Lachnospiraceae bacterium]
MKILEMNLKQNAYPANAASNQTQGDKSIELKKVFDNIPEAEVSISKEGMAAWEEAVTKRTGCFGTMTGIDENLKRITRAQTNEVSFEHLMEFGSVMKEVEKTYGGDGVDSFMKTIAGAYEIMYRRIVEQHKDGDREVDYELSGKGFLSLEEDLAGLDEAYDYWSQFVEADILMQQWRKGWSPAGVISLDGEQGPQKDRKFMGEEYNAYRREAVDIMRRGKEDFLATFRALNGDKGIMAGIMNRLMSQSVGFWEKTRELWS